MMSLVENTKRHVKPRTRSPPAIAHALQVSYRWDPRDRNAANNKICSNLLDRCYQKRCGHRARGPASQLAIIASSEMRCIAISQCKMQQNLKFLNCRQLFVYKQKVTGLQITMLELQDCGFKFERDFESVLSKYNVSNSPNDA